MHKFYFAILGLFVSATTVLAQDVDETLQFVMADGTVVPSGSTITVSTAETTTAGKVEIKSGLYVKTNVESGGSYLSLGYSVSAPNGNVQLCFPMNCQNISGNGESSIGMMRAGSYPQDLQSEWLPTAYGTATVVYTLKKYNYAGMGGPHGLTPLYDFLNDCSTVTVKYVYADPAGINEAIDNGNAVDVDETLQFVMADGTVVPSGSTITASTAETTTAGKVEIKSGLYVKTNVESGGSYLSVGYSVSAPNGDVQLCFPMNCQNISGNGESSIGMMRAGSDPQDLQSEWFPTAYGTATVVYTLKKYNYAGMGGPMGLTPLYDFLNDCSTVTVKYVYADPAGINEAIANGNAVAVTYYDMAGRKVLHPGKGLFIKKATMADGTVKTAKVALNNE